MNPVNEMFSHDWATMESYWAISICEVVGWMDLDNL